MRKNCTLFSLDFIVSAYLNKAFNYMIKCIKIVVVEYENMTLFILFE